MRWPKQDEFGVGRLTIKLCFAIGGGGVVSSTAPFSAY